MFFKCVYCQKRYFFPSNRLECYREHRREEELAFAAAERSEQEQDRIIATEERQHKKDVVNKRQTTYRPPSHVRSNNYGERDRQSSDPLLLKVDPMITVVTVDRLLRIPHHPAVMNRVQTTAAVAVATIKDHGVVLRSPSPVMRSDATVGSR